MTLLLTVCSGAWADNTTTFDFSGGSSEGLTITKSGTVANVSYSITNETYNQIPTLSEGNYFLGVNFTSNSAGILDVVTTSSFSKIKSISFDCAAADNSNPKVAIYIVDDKGEETEVQASMVLSSGSTKVWRSKKSGSSIYTLDLSSSPKTGKVHFKFTTGSSSKSGAIDDIKITTESSTPAADPTFSPDGGNVEGLSTVNIVSEGQTTYYQWSTNASASLTTASEGWSTGTSAEVPNTDGTYYLYAYASNGSDLNSSVVCSEAFYVTSVSVTAATISWAFNNNTAPASAVLSDGSDMISGSTVTMGSNLAFEANTDHCYVDSEGEDDVNVSRVKPSSVASSNDLVFSIDLKDGVTFLPTSISFVAMKQGTGNAVTLDAKWYEDGKSDIALLTSQALKRASSSGTYAKPGGDRFVIDPAEKSVSASAGTTGLRLVLNNTNSYGIGEIKITGRFIGSPVVPTESYTVTFNAGSNGTCATASLTEKEPGAGVTLPAVTPAPGYGFLGWFTAADGGTKVGDANDTYHPSENITIYAQYQEEVAPTISINEYNPETLKNVSVTLTATATGSPDPTVTWYQSATAVTSGGTSKGTGLTFNPDVTTVGTFYYYAVASNGVSPDATSNLITLTVNDPDQHVNGNAYYVSVGEQAVPDEQIFCDDITMTFVNGKSGEGFTTAVSDGYLNNININFVASLTGTSSNNGWKARFVPTVAGTLSVGVIINGGKTFSITGVTGFSYVGKQDEGDNVTSDVEETNGSGTMKPEKKIMVLVTIDVEAGTTYDFSVSGSKMGFYGFEFTPTVKITPAYAKTTYVTTKALDFSNVSGLKAYVATAAAAGKVTLTEVGAVPAGTPLMLIGTANTEYTVPVAASATAPTTNMFLAGDGTTTFTGSSFDYILYTDGLFHPISGGSVATTKAYLHCTTDPTAGAPGASRSLAISFGDETTGISQIENRTMNAENNVFNLSGQRVSKPTKGLYIVNGKKVILK